jgi:hypothetical protein
VDDEGRDDGDQMKMMRKVVTLKTVKESEFTSSRHLFSKPPMMMMMRANKHRNEVSNESTNHQFMKELIKKAGELRRVFGDDTGLRMGAIKDASFRSFSSSAR